MKKKILIISSVFMFLSYFGSNLNAQVTLGGELYSRYVWRGADYGNSASFQPAFDFTSGPISVGAWAAYSLTADGAAADESDLYATVALGPASITITDYYFPMTDGDGGMFFNFDDGGAHYIEAAVSAEVGPASILLTSFIHNDDTLYGEVGFPVGDLSFFVGASLNDGGMYGTTEAGLVSVGFSGGKEIPISSEFSLPIGVTYVLNPTAEKTWLILSMSF